jgi:hypothetical protein
MPTVHHFLWVEDAAISKLLKDAESTVCMLYGITSK